jgi:ubiquinone/menaquinone biosynthesis C-methylase UbiE
VLYAKRDDMHRNKWPKTLPPLTTEQQIISDDFMKYWHETLASNKKFNIIENFNHGYPAKHRPNDFIKTLEIGAGLGEHLRYEKLSDVQLGNYVALEIRDNMAKQIRLNHPTIDVQVADCQQDLPYCDHYFDRIIAIHVLEHLANLPAAIREIYRICDKNKGIFSVVIPCEGGFAYSCARRLSAKRLFEKRYQQSYDWFIQREHLSMPYEIMEELAPYFTIAHRSYFPLQIPSVHMNLCIGLTLKPRI